MEPVILFQSLKDSQEEALLANRYFAVFDSVEEIPIGSRVICRYFIQEPYIKLEKVLSERASYLLNTRKHLDRAMDLDHRTLTEFSSYSTDTDKKGPDYRLFFLRGIPIQIQRLEREFSAGYWSSPESVPPSVLETTIKIAKRAAAQDGLPFFYLDVKKTPSYPDWRLDGIGDACFSSLEEMDIDLFYRNLRTALLKYRRNAEA